MRSARIHQRTLRFKKPAGTSRGTMLEKPAWYIELRHGDKVGYGECGLLPGLSADDRPEFEQTLRTATGKWADTGAFPDLSAWPSIRFGAQTALKSLENSDPFLLFPSAFARGEAPIPINGLIWMAPPEDMKRQIDAKIKAGFTCIKMKIGALDFAEELALLKETRKSFSARDIMLRVDANGAFSPQGAGDKLDALAELDLHSIEQPIKAGQWEQMAALCEASPVPIALDEEVIGLDPSVEGASLMDTVRPQAVIVKPGLLGGFDATDAWIALAEEHGAQWWATSALESNVGLNAIAQYTYSKDPKTPQGLGTGSLYRNNVPGALSIKRGALTYDPDGVWGNPFDDESL